MQDKNEMALAAAMKACSTVSNKKTVISKSTETGDWDSIKGSKLPYHMKSTLSWNSSDLLAFFVDSFKETTGHDFLIPPALGRQSVLVLKDSIKKMIGYLPDNQITVDYIRWFMQNKAMPLMDKYNCFKFKFMNASWNIEEFFTTVRKLDKKEIAVNNDIKKASIFNLKTMESAYIVSPDNFVLKYGLILSAVWMMNVLGLSEDDAAQKVKKSAANLSVNGKYDEIVMATEMHNPYPCWCKFSLLSRMLSELTSETDDFFDIVRARFSDESTAFEFLKSKE